MTANRQRVWQQALIALGLCTVALACLAGFAGYRYVEASQALRDARQRLASAAGAPVIPPVPQSLLQAAQAAIPPTPEIPQWLQAFRQTTESAGLKWIGVRQVENGGAPAPAAAAAAPAQGLARITFEATLSGDYAQAAAFLRNLAGWQRLVHPVKWQISRAAAKTPGTSGVTLTVTLVSYHLPRQGAGTPAPVEQYMPSGKLDPTR
jgi:hypothetical protein